MNDTATHQTSHQLSLLLYQAIAAAARQQTHLLAEKYRSLEWDSPQRKSEFVRTVAAEFAKADGSQPLLVQRVEQLLRAVFINDFFKLSVFRSLMEQAEHIARSGSETVPSEPQTLKTQTNGNKAQANAIAVLLLDAENIKLTAAEEQFLQNSCGYIIQIKIAFANWRTLGKYDLDFYGRGYQLIHVPAGKNSADMKMTAIGSSIFLQYPNTKAVFVCSSDQDLTHLNNTLQTHGLTVYSVRKQANLLVVNNASTRAKQFDPAQAAKTPSIAQSVVWLQEVIQSLATQSAWVKLSRISTAFNAAHGISLSQVMRVQAGKRPIDIFLEHPQIFVMHQSTENAEIYVSLFMAPLPDTRQKTDAATPEEIPLEPQFSSRGELEQELIRILQELLVKPTRKRVPIAELHTQFHKRHKQALKPVLQHLDIKLRYVNFLESCSVFRLEKSPQGWLIWFAKP